MPNTPVFSFTPMMQLLLDLDNGTRFQTIDSIHWATHPQHLEHPHYRVMHVYGKDQNGKVKILSLEMLWEKSFAEDVEGCVKILRDAAEYIKTFHCMPNLVSEELNDYSPVA